MYTKGEWEVYESPCAPEVIIKGQSTRPDRIIAICRLERGSEDMAEATANAHLIAAAPKLYEAIKSCMRGEEEWIENMHKAIAEVVEK